MDLFGLRVSLELRKLELQNENLAMGNKSMSNATMIELIDKALAQMGPTIETKEEAPKVETKSRARKPKPEPVEIEKPNTGDEVAETPEPPSELDVALGDGPGDANIVVDHDRIRDLCKVISKTKGAKGKEAARSVLVKFVGGVGAVSEVKKEDLAKVYDELSKI